ncbi:MAG: SipW-dependent-type signal peptide-containing protein [Clostridia bacterium]
MSKINKLGKSTFAIAILSFILVAVLAFGGTYAYFSAVSTNSPTGTLNTAKLSLGAVTGKAIDDADTGKINFTGVVQPNQILAIDAFSATVTANMKYYVRVKFEMDINDNGHNHKGPTEVAGEVTEDDLCKDYYGNVIEAFSINTTDVDNESKAIWHAGNTTNTTEGTVHSSSRYFYMLAPQEVASGQTSKSHTITFTIRPNADLGNYNGTADGCTYWMDMPITIAVTFEVLQAEYLTDGALANARTFGNATLAEEAWSDALAVANGVVDAPAEED